MDHKLCELPTICEQCHHTLSDSINKAIGYSNSGYYYAAVYCEHASVLAIAEVEFDEVLGVSLHAPLTAEQANELMNIKTEGANTSNTLQ